MLEEVAPRVGRFTVMGALADRWASALVIVYRTLQVG